MSSSFALNRRARVLLASVSTATLLAGGGFVHGLGVLNAGASLDAPVRTAQASFGTVSIEQVVARPDQLVQVRVSLNNQGERAIDIRPSMFRLYDATLALPIIGVAVALGLLGAARLAGRPGAGLPGWLAAAASACGVAFAASVAFGVLAPLHDLLLDGGAPQATAYLPVPLHMLRDG